MPLANLDRTILVLQKVKEYVDEHYKITPDKGYMIIRYLDSSLISSKKKF